MSDIFEENSPENGENISPQAEEIPLVETSFRVNGESQKRFQHKIHATLIAAVVIGAVFTLAYIVLATLNGETLGGSFFAVSETLLYVLLLCGAVPLGGGISLLFVLRKNVAYAKRTDAENHYRFFADHVLVAVTQNGEPMGQVKCYYKSFAKVRENRNYFLLYPTSSTVYPVLKSALPEEEREKLRTVLPLKK